MESMCYSFVLLTSLPTKEHLVGPLNIALLVIMTISAILTVLLVLIAAIFGICICIMALTFPIGTIGV